MEELIKLRKDGREFYWGRRNIGKLSEDGKRFITTRTPEHLFRKMQAFCFNHELIIELIALNIPKIILIYKNSKGEEKVFITTPKEIRDKGTTIKESIFENQIAMPLGLFEKR